MLLKVEGLSLVSDQGIIVDDLSFTVDRGQIITLTGKSGSGKTSIGLAILGILPKGIRWQKGSMIWRSDVESEWRYPEQSDSWATLRGRQIAYIQQDVFGIFDPVLRIGHQLMMMVRERRHNDLPALELELREKMVEVGIRETDRVWNSYPHQLSGGQLQRCQICLSIVLQPLLIIADEPTSAIDQINQVEILDLLSFVRDKYRTAILCITHEETVVHYLSDKSINIGENPVPYKEQKEETVITANTEKNPVLRVEGLGFNHRFGGLLDRKGATIKGIDFALYKGQCLGIIGESGSGKSSLANLLVGLLTPSQGRVILHDREIDFKHRRDIHFLRSKIQLVMQDGRGSLHPNKTIRWLLQEVIDLQPEKDQDHRIDFQDILNEVGLTSLVLDKTESSLSGGECLRVNIARALLIKPDILICDESTSSLDSVTRDGILRLLISLMKQQKLALILIVHDDNILRRVAQDVLVLAGGEVVEKGSVRQVLDNPQHPATRKIFLSHATLSKKRNL